MTLFGSIKVFDPSQHDITYSQAIILYTRLAARDVISVCPSWAIIRSAASGTREMNDPSCAAIGEMADRAGLGTANALLLIRLAIPTRRICTIDRIMTRYWRLETIEDDLSTLH